MKHRRFAVLLVVLVLLLGLVPWLLRAAGWLLWLADPIKNID